MTDKNHKNILILDDEEPLLHYLPIIFKNYFYFPYYLITIKDGDDALRIINDSNIPFDLFITDINHPGKHCRDIIKILKKEYPSIKIMVSSAMETSNHREWLTDADVILPKPYTESAFIHVVKSILFL